MSYWRGVGLGGRPRGLPVLPVLIGWALLLAAAADGEWLVVAVFAPGVLAYTIAKST